MKGIKKNFAAFALGTLATIGTAYAENQEATAKTDQTADESLCVANTASIQNGSEGVKELANTMADRSKSKVAFETYSANNDQYTFLKVKAPNSTGHLLVNEKAETVCEITAETYNRFKLPAP